MSGFRRSGVACSLRAVLGAEGGEGERGQIRRPPPVLPGFCPPLRRSTVCTSVESRVLPAEQLGAELAAHDLAMASSHQFPCDSATFQEKC